MQSAPLQPDAGWDTPEVAAGQRALVESELARHPSRVPPYAAFLRMLDRVGPAHGWSLLDVGCGVGHYGSLLHRWEGTRQIRYRGIDASPHMIAIAREREPELEFALGRLEDDPLMGDIVLLSQVVEVGPTPIEHLSRALSIARGYIILNKIRFAASSGFIEEPTYAGHRGPIFVWEPREFLDHLKATRRDFDIDRWPERPDSASALIYPI